MKKLLSVAVIYSLFTIHRPRLLVRRTLLAVLCSLFTVHLLVKPALAATNFVNPNTYYKNRYPNYVRNLESGAANEIKDDRFNRRQTELTLLSLGDGMLRPGSKDTALAQISTAIAGLTGKPAVSGKEYLAYMAGKAGFVDPAYAQQQRGGFDVLKPVQKIWIATRNIAYLVTSLTLVVIGFMIMLRKKIDAQTVIGIQQALPKLVVTLLLITFSYAIAGFLIDMIYFLMFFGIKLLATFGVLTDGGSGAISQFLHKNLFNIGLASIYLKVPGNPESLSATAADAAGVLVQALLIENVGTGAAGAISDLVAQPIAFVIFAVAILFALFKLFFSLLMSYAQIILLTILGPLQLMLNALPGSDAFSKWFRNLLANTMAFPAAVMMIMFAVLMMGVGSSQPDSSWGVAECVGFDESPNCQSENAVQWVPPLIFGDGAGAQNAVNALQALIGLGILLMTPKVVDMVKEWVQAPEFKYGSAIGEAVGFGWSGAKAGVSRGWGATRGYDEAIAQQRAQAMQRYIEVHGAAPTGAALDAINDQFRQRPFGSRGEKGWVRGRLSAFLGK